MNSIVKANATLLPVIPEEENENETGAGNHSHDDDDDHLFDELDMDLDIVELDRELNRLASKAIRKASLKRSPLRPYKVAVKHLDSLKKSYRKNFATNLDSLEQSGVVGVHQQQKFVCNNNSNQSSNHFTADINDNCSATTSNNYNFDHNSNSQTSLLPFSALFSASNSNNSSYNCQSHSTDYLNSLAKNIPFTKTLPVLQLQEVEDALSTSFSQSSSQSFGSTNDPLSILNQQQHQQFAPTSSMELVSNNFLSSSSTSQMSLTQIEQLPSTQGNHLPTQEWSSITMMDVDHHQSNQSFVQSYQQSPQTQNTSSLRPDANSVAQSHPVIKSILAKPPRQSSTPGSSLSTAQSQSFSNPATAISSHDHDFMPPLSQVVLAETTTPIVVLQYNYRNANEDDYAALGLKRDATGQPVFPAHQGVVDQIIQKLVFAPMSLEQMIVAIENRQQQTITTGQNGSHTNFNQLNQAENSTVSFDKGSPFIFLDCPFCPNQQQPTINSLVSSTSSTFNRINSNSNSTSSNSPFTLAAAHLWTAHSRVSLFCRHCRNRFAARVTFVSHLSHCFEFQTKSRERVLQGLLGPKGTQLLVWNEDRELLQMEGSIKKWAALYAHLFMSPSFQSSQTAFFELMKEFNFDELLPGECRMCAVYLQYNNDDKNTSTEAQNDGPAEIAAGTSLVPSPLSTSGSSSQSPKLAFLKQPILRHIETRQAVQLLIHLAAHHAYFRFICLPCASKHVLFLKLNHFETNASEACLGNPSQAVKLDLATMVRCSIPFALGPFLSEHRRVAGCSDDHYAEGTIVLVRYLTVSFLEEAFSRLLNGTIFSLANERDAYTKAEVRALEAEAQARFLEQVTLPVDVRTPFEMAVENRFFNKGPKGGGFENLVEALELMAGGKKLK